MVSKRKNRKIKREIKRRIARNRQNQQQNQENDPRLKPGSQAEMMLKLMAMLKNGGQNGQNTDPGTFLRLKEEAVAKSNENARLKRDYKIQEQKAKEQEKREKENFELKQQQVKTENAQQSLLHKQQMNQLRLDEQGLTDEYRKIQNEINEGKHQIALNTQAGNIEQMKTDIEKLARERDQIKKSIDFLQPSQEIRHTLNAIYKRMSDSLADFNKLYDVMKKSEITQQELEHMKHLHDSMLKDSFEIMRLNQEVDQSIRQAESNIQDLQKRTDQYNQEQQELDRKKIELRRLEAQIPYASMVAERNRDGTIKLDIPDNALRNVVNAMEDPIVVQIRDESNNIMDWLKDNYPKIIHSSFTLEDLFDIVHERYGRKPELKGLLEKITSEYNSEKGQKIEGHNTFITLKRRLIQLEKDGNIAWNNAKKKEEEDQAYNDEIIQNAAPVMSKITPEKWAELAEQNKVQQLKIDEYEHEMSNDEKLKKEYKKLQNERDRKDAYVKQLPERKRGERQKTLKDIAQLKIDVRNLEKTEKDRDDDDRYLDSLHQENKTLTRKKERKNVEIENMPESVDKDKLEMIKKVEELKHDLRKQDELKNIREMTYKFEKHNRELAASVDAQTADEARKLEQEIAVAIQKQEEEKTRNQLLEKQHQSKRDLQRIEALNRAKTLAMQGESNEVDEQLETSVAFNAEVAGSVREEITRKEQLKRFVDAVKNDGTLLDRFNEWGAEKRSPWEPFGSVDDLSSHSWSSSEDGIAAINEFEEYWRRQPRD